MSRRKEIDAGEAISIESALTIMVVLILIRLLFFIPLVNIDRAHLDKAQKDTYWSDLAKHLEAAPHDTSEALPYLHTFNLEADNVIVTSLGDRSYVEALSPSGEITVICRRGESYILLVCKGGSTAVSYQYGDIRYSPAEREWFTANTTIDYGDKEITKTMQKEYRAWTKTTRGF